jgi:hypothetical protein
MYVKLFGSILDSSIWTTDSATRVVWITMLAMADEFGVVHASLGGLARRAQVPLKDCKRALKILSSPDADDRSGVERGVRIRQLQGAWELINYQKYRELRSRKQIVDAARQARYRKQHVTAGRDTSQSSVTRHDVTVEAEAEAEAKIKSKACAPHNGARPRKSWLAPFGTAYQQVYPDGEPQWGEMARYLAPLRRRTPDTFAALAERVEAYFRAEGVYGSWKGFAQTGGQTIVPDRRSQVEADREVAAAMVVVRSQQTHTIT